MEEYEVIEEWIDVKEPVEQYGSVNDITYEIIGACFDVYNELGRGVLEAVYKDALEYELRKRNVQFTRERKFEIHYKEVVLPHFYVADFIIENQVVLEVKALQGAADENKKQVINYLAISKCKI